jgi:hypothetical protein
MQEQVVSDPVERVVGRIEAGLESLSKQLDDHTRQDTENFAKLSAQIAALDARLDQIDVTKAAIRLSRRWAIGVATAVAGVAQVARALGWIP